jgi:hypothetical protein
MVARHRVALELEVVQGPDEMDPEDWDLQDLRVAVRRGQARVVRTIRGLVVDPENDRLSDTIETLADDIDEAVDLQWLAIGSRHPAIARAVRAKRLPLALLVELQQYAEWGRRIAERLDEHAL